MRKSSKNKTTYVVIGTFNGGRENEVVLPYHYISGEEGFDTVQEAMDAINDMVYEDPQHFEGLAFTIAGVTTDLVRVALLEPQRPFKLEVLKGD